ncbi:hypothetical protein HYV12_02255 [Candidatus Dojkabacteria bacterium]|nr:hypothetical protein [Candidatus Dojkabacteria bacterium]
MKYNAIGKKRYKERKSLKHRFSVILAKIKSRKGRKGGLRTVKRLPGKSIFRSLFLLFLILGSIFLLTILIKYVSNLRTDVLSGNGVSKEKVVGFDEVPEFPSSSFIFKGNLENDDVKRFLSGGQSIYRLEPGNSFDDVIEYYSKTLPDNGWEHVLSVPLESEEQKYGEYWVKGDVGLRIYSKLNDIWYQTLSVNDAKTGLAAQVKQEVEFQLLLSEDAKQDLRPDFPWILSFSNDYIATYNGTDVGELQSVVFQRLGSNKTVRIDPLGYKGAFSYDRFLENELKKVNKKEKSSWMILNTVVTVVSGQEALFAKIVDGGKFAEAYIVGNPRNTIVYIFRSSDEGDPFLKYIVERIQPAKTSLN